MFHCMFRAQVDRIQHHLKMYLLLALIPFHTLLSFELYVPVIMIYIDLPY